MSIEVVYDWRQWDAFAQDLQQLRAMIPGVLEGAVEEVGLFIEREAKVNLTESGGVDTGRLRASIGHGADGVWKVEQSASQVVVYVGTNVEYAPYVEYGFTMSTPHTVYLPGVGFRYIHPFTFEGYHYMEKAAEAARSVAPKILEKRIGDALEETIG